MPTIPFGRDTVDVLLDADSLIPLRHRPIAPALTDVPAAVRAALEAPLGFPPLRRALTPDDRITIVVDDHLPRLPELLGPVLEHLALAGVGPSAVTLLTADAGPQAWLDALPDDFAEVRVEVHNPAERKKLAYLATTRRGQRIYVNRTAVDADQVIVLGRPDADPLLIRGGAGALYPALGDEAARQERADRLAETGPAPRAQALRDEAAEVAWLLGAPFLLQVVEGAGDEIVHVVGGPVDTGDEARSLYEARWGLTADRRADTVVATVAGDPERHDFSVLARALAHAARLVEPDGRIVLLTEASPELGPAAEVLRRAGDPERAVDLLRRQKPPGMGAAMLWATAARRAQVYLLSRLPDDVAEELFVTPMEQARQAQRLAQGGRCLLLEDADKALPHVRPDEDVHD